MPLSQAVALVLAEPADVWPNLLQGALGSVFGSAIGVLGAYYVASSSLRKQLALDRRLHRESRSLETAGDFIPALLQLRQRVRVLGIPAWPNVTNDGYVRTDYESSWEENREAVLGLHDSLDALRSLMLEKEDYLPAPLATALHQLLNALAALLHARRGVYAPGILNPPPAPPLNDLYWQVEGATQDALHHVAAFRREPQRYEQDAVMALDLTAPPGNWHADMFGTLDPPRPT